MFLVKRKVCKIDYAGRYVARSHASKVATIRRTVVNGCWVKSELPRAAGNHLKNDRVKKDPISIGNGSSRYRCGTRRRMGICNHHCSNDTARMKINT